MELLLLFLTIVLGVGLAYLVNKAYRDRENYQAYWFIREQIQKRRKTPPLEVEATSRMLVVVRRHQAARTKLLTLGDEEAEAYVNKIKADMQKLIDAWIEKDKVTYKWGFHGSDYGLPSNGEDNWQLFASFGVPNYETYRTCLSMLENDEFLALRNHCDIRLLYGEAMQNIAEYIHELF